MKLTKAQRHNYYKIALKLFKQDNDFLCMVLYRAIGSPMAMHLDEVRESFPEFSNQKPDGVDVFWFGTKLDLAERKIRIAVLNKCIRETSPKKKSKR